jgi:hypothetical protein
METEKPLMPKPQRNTKGQFVEGREGQKRKPGEPVIPHPYHPTRDIAGRLLPGGMIQDAHKGTKFAELREALASALTVDELRNVVKQLFALCLPGKHSAHVQLHAIALLFERFFGKPVAPIIVNKQETVTVTHDYTSLTDDELKTIERILEKHRVQKAIGAGL